MDPKTHTIERIEVEDFSASVAGWKTTLFNCECHTFAQVIEQLVTATGCSGAAASQLANTVHHNGSAVVYRGAKDECERVAKVLGLVGLVADVTW